MEKLLADADASHYLDRVEVDIKRGHWIKVQGLGNRTLRNAARPTWRRTPASASAEPSCSRSGWAMPPRWPALRYIHAVEARDLEIAKVLSDPALDGNAAKLPRSR